MTDDLFLVNICIIGKHTESIFLAIGARVHRTDKAFLTKAGFSETFTDLIAELDRQETYYVRFDAEGTRSRALRCSSDPRQSLSQPVGFILAGFPLARCTRNSLQSGLIPPSEKEPRL